MSKTAIVVDDDFDSVEIFCMMLEERGVNIIGRGYSGREAIELFKEKKPDVIFLDISMPDGTGFHAIRNIKKINESAKIIPVTANEDYKTKKKLDDLGISNVIYKPVDIDKIMNLIES